MAYQNWDELAAHCRYRAEIMSVRPMFADAYAGDVEAIELLRQEFEFETLHPGLSHEALTLSPFPEKPQIYIFCEKPGELSNFSIWTGDAFSDKATATQEQLIPTVYDYLKKLRAL